MLSRLIKEIEKIDPTKVNYWNSTTEIASRIGLIQEPKLAVQLVQLISLLEKKQQENFEARKERIEEDDE